MKILVNKNSVVVFWGKMMNICKFMNSENETKILRLISKKQMILMRESLFRQGS